MINETWVSRYKFMLFENIYFIRPEADPAVLLAWIENDVDLANIHRAARVK